VTFEKFEVRILFTMHFFGFSSRKPTVAFKTSKEVESEIRCNLHLLEKK